MLKLDLKYLFEGIAPLKSYQTFYSYVCFSLWTGYIWIILKYTVMYQSTVKTSWNQKYANDIRFNFNCVFSLFKLYRYDLQILN